MVRPNVFSSAHERFCKTCERYVNGEGILERGYAMKLYDNLSYNPNTNTWIMIAKDTFNEMVYPGSRVVDTTNYLMHLMVDIQWTCPICGKSELTRSFLNPFVGDWDNFLPDLKKYIDTKDMH